MYRSGAAAVLAVAAMGLMLEAASAFPGSQFMSNGTWCRTWFGKPHAHWGDSTGKTSEAEAYLNAVRNWSAFVKLEYGSRYADFNLAQKKQVACKDERGNWGCIVKAQACRL